MNATHHAHRAHRRRSRRDTPVRARGGAAAGDPVGTPAHFGGLCLVVEQLRATSAADSGFDDDAATEARTRQDHVERLLALAGRLDPRGDGSGHALRRSVCLGLQQTAWRVDAARALIASVARRPRAERIDLYWLLEDQLIVGFGDRRRMTASQCRQIHAMLAAVDRM